MEAFNNRLSAALFEPVMQTRCAELTVLFTRCNIKELQAFYPTLLDHIFGARHTKTSWGLHTIMSNSCDFQILQHFFSPMGPLFQLIYTLLKDLSLKYKFDLSELPNIQLSDFYMDMIYTHSPNANKSTILLLNPFDYYIFSFAQHLLDSRHSVQESGENIKLNSLYYILCCDYVLHFLPSNYNSMVLPEVAYEGKITQMKTYPVVQRSLNNSNLFKQSTRSDLHELIGYHFHPKRDIWRSETVLHVFIDFWLYIRPIGSYTPYDFMINLGYAELPSLEQIRIVRILSKQIHAFASVASLDQSNLSELRKISRSLLLEKIYIFLRYLIYRWPLDGSFRLVLELWLSYIQPWRYCSIMQNNMLQGYEVKQDGNINQNKVCNEAYLPFIAENILHYVVIFQQLLPRFLRVDLSTPQNSLMLYRLMKVFNQDNLADYLKNIEMHIDQDNDSPRHFVQHYTALPPLSLTPSCGINNTVGMNQSSFCNMVQSYSAQNETMQRNVAVAFGDKYANIARQSIYKLEGVHFRYKSLLNGISEIEEVIELLKYIKISETAALQILYARQAYNNKQSTGFFGFFRSIFSIFHHSIEDSALDERRKVPLHLQCAFQYMVDMFEIQNYNIDSIPMQNQDTFPHLPTASSTNEDSLTHGSISELMTPEKVKQRTMSIVYEGDPDLYPIGSHENTLLVRIMYQFSLILNSLCGAHIAALYETQNFMGKFARRFIMAPKAVAYFNTSQKGRRQQINNELPPRISFRKLASNRVILLLIIAYICLQYTGYNKWLYILTFIVLFFSFHAISALFD